MFFRKTVLVIFFSFLFLSTAFAKQDNLIQDSGFENFTTWWYRLDIGTATFVRTTSDSGTGDYSAKIQMTSTTGQADWRQVVTGIDADTKYSFRALINAKPTVALANSHSVELQWFDSASNYLGRETISATASNQWCEVIKTGITPPAGAVKVYILTRVYKEGDYYFDDIALLKEDLKIHKIDGKFPIAIQKPAAVDLVINPDMEERHISNGNAPRTWYKWTDSGTATFEWCDTKASSGAHSLKIDMTQAGQVDWRQYVFNIENGSSYTYNLSAKIFATDVSAGSHNVFLAWMNGSNQCVGTNSVSASTINNWNQVEISDMTPPSGATRVAVLLRAYKVGTYYFDDVNFSVDMTPEEQVAQAANNGVKLFYGHPNSSGTSGAKAVMATADVIDKDNMSDLTDLIDRVNTVEHYEDIALWNLPDEPAWSNFCTAAEMKTVYDTIVANDDYYDTYSRKVWLNHAGVVRGADPANLSLLKDWSYAADIVSIDVYPVPRIFGASVLANKTISCIGDYVDTLYDDVVSWDGIQQKPIWMFIQGFNWHNAFYDKGTHGVEIIWINSSDEMISKEVFRSEKANQWDRVKLDGLKPPAGTVKAFILLRVYNTGTYYFDDVSLKLQSSQTELVDNFDFESFTTWYSHTDFGTAAFDISSTERYRSYANSCKIYVDPSVNTDRVQSHVKQEINNIDPNSTYDFSAWIYTDNADRFQDPTKEEMRFMAYNAIIHGAKGVGFWLEKTNTLEDIWFDILDVTSELSGLDSILISKDSFRKVTVNNTNIETLLLQDGDDIYLLCANTSGSAISNVSFDVDDLLCKNTVNEVIENTSISIQSGSFMDSFSAYEVHVYNLESSIHVDEY